MSSKIRRRKTLCFRTVFQMSLFSLDFSITAGSVIVLILALGCSNENGEINKTSLQVLPQVLSLGEVAATGQKIQGNFKVTNRGEEKQFVEIKSSCGCVITDSRQLFLKPGSTHEVTFSVSSYGRAGDFYAEILVQAAGHSKLIPVKAVFLPQVFAFPSRVVLLRNEEKQLTSEITIQAPEDLWPQLSMESVESETQVLEIEKKGASRRFRVSAKQTSPTFSPIVLRKIGQSEPVLSVPVLNGTLSVAHNLGHAKE